MVSNASEDLFISKLQSLLSTHHKNVGVAQSHGAYINNLKINNSDSLYSATESLLLNASIDAMIVFIDSLHDIAFQGLPFDRYDILFFLEVPQATNDAEVYLLHSLLNAADNSKIINEETSEYLTNLNIIDDKSMFLTRSEIFCHGSIFLAGTEELDKLDAS